MRPRDRRASERVCEKENKSEIEGVSKREREREKKKERERGTRERERERERGTRKSENERERENANSSLMNQEGFQRIALEDLKVSKRALSGWTRRRPLAGILPNDGFSLQRLFSSPPIFFFPSLSFMKNSKDL